MSGMYDPQMASGAPPSEDGSRMYHGSEGDGRGYGSSYGGRGGGYGNPGGGGYGGGGNPGGRDRRPGGGGSGGGRGGGQRDGDWVCPNSSCGNVNFARRVECNKCGTGKPGGGTEAGFNSGYGGGGGNRGYRGSSYGGGGDGYGGQGAGGGGGGGYKQGGNYGSQGGPGSYASGNDYANQASTGTGGGYGYGGGQIQGNALAAGNAYGAQAAPPRADYGGYSQGDNRGRGGYGGDSRGSRGGDYGGDNRGSRGGEYGDNKGSRGGDYGGDNRASRGSDYAGDNRGSRGGEYGGGYSQGDNRGSRGQGGFDSHVPERGSADLGQYGGGSDTVKVKQCDENCNETCDNARIYISGLPLDTTVDELRELFGGIGQVARIKQKRGYKDQWPWNIKLYTDSSGQNKGDGVLVYEDPSAAHSAGGFFNDHVLRGNQIKVIMAEKSAPRPSGGGHGQGHGGGHGGPDRRFGGGHRSRPY